MKRRRSVALAVASAIILLSPVARAEGEPSAGDEAPSWLFGVGVSLHAVALGVGAGPLVGGPIYSTGVERRLSESLWLTGQLRGSFASSDTEDDWQTSVSYNVGGLIGLRPVLNPGDRVEVSLTAGLGSSYSRLHESVMAWDEAGELVPATFDARFWSVHVDTGLAVDFWFTRSIGLRAASRILTLGHQASWQGAKQSAWYAELGLTPALALQLGF